MTFTPEEENFLRLLIDQKKKEITLIKAREGQRAQTKQLETDLITASETLKAAVA